MMKYLEFNSEVAWTSSIHRQGIFTLVCGIAFVTMMGCMRPDTESTSKQLEQLAKVYTVSWPTNYSNDHAASLRYSALDSHDNTVTIARLEVDKASYQAWFAQNEKRMDYIAEGKAIDEDKMSEKFPWYNPQVYAESEVTILFRETSTPPNYFAKLHIYAVNSNGLHIMFVHSWVSK